MSKRVLKILLIFVVLDLLGAGAFWFGYSTIKGKKDEETQLRAELADEGKKTMQQASLRRALKQAEDEREVLTKYFYDQGEESQINFVAQIEGLGLPVSGVIIDTGSFSFVAGGTPSFRGEFGLKGRWEEVHHFLRLIETFPARLIIRRFTIQSSGGSNSENEIWNGSMSLELTSLKGN
ncbi:MAG: hypothetical protein Q8P56_05315 [Candidatus Uhrbacteria bacterium]|nr:hypothetical protein [Candidatus Uhrbacteria bacterium]